MGAGVDHAVGLMVVGKVGIAGIAIKGKREGFRAG